MAFNEWLVAKGFDPEAVSEAQKLALQAAWRADQNPPDPRPKPAPDPKPESKDKDKDTSYEDTLAAIEAESERVMQIREHGLAAIKQHMGNPEKQKVLREMTEAAVADTRCDFRKFQLDLMRQGRFDGPFVYATSKPQVTAEVLEAAVCKVGGLQTLGKEFGEQTLAQADKAFRHGIGLQELIGMAARQNGWQGTSVKGDLRNALRASLAADFRQDVGPSTYSLSGILANVANKFVRESFLFVEDTWRRISARRSVSDFKQISTYSLTGDLTYEKLEPGGRIQHGTVSETGYTNQADTYAKLLGIDRRDLINDDQGALTGASRRLGRGGALKLCDVFWAEFMDNSTFFTAPRGNYDDGASDTLMDATGLSNANTLFQLLNDPDGKPTGTMPATVLVPPHLWALAWRLLEGRMPGDTTATASPFAGMFKLEQSRYLANSSFTGYSAKAWYLLADPNDLPVIEIAFLNGQEMPTVETAEMEFDRLGIALRGYHDFGVNLQEYRAGVKMKGEA